MKLRERISNILSNLFTAKQPVERTIQPIAEKAPFLNGLGNESKLENTKNNLDLKGEIPLWDMETYLELEGDQLWNWFDSLPSEQARKGVEEMQNFIHYSERKLSEEDIMSGYNFLDPDPVPTNDEARAFFAKKTKESEVAISSLKQDLEQMKDMIDFFHHEHSPAQEIDTNSSFDDEWRVTRVPATILPSGWEWVKYDDGSGHLEGPEGQQLFSYDLAPYSYANGVEFKETDANGWSLYWNNEDQDRDFWKFAEEKVLLQHLPQQEFPSPEPAPYYEPEM